MSTRFWNDLVFRREDALHGAVFAGVVGEAILPAVPDDVEPGAGEDADGMWVVVSSVAGVAVELGGPGAGASAVTGEVADGVSELFVAGPAEPDGAALAGLPGGGGGAGQAGSRAGVQAAWEDVVDDWRRSYQPAMDAVRRGTDWRNLDAVQRDTLADVLHKRDIDLPGHERECLVSPGDG